MTFNKEIFNSKKNAIKTLAREIKKTKIKLKNFKSLKREDRYDPELLKFRIKVLNDEKERIERELKLMENV
jgi:hypothetical protein